MYTCFIYNIYIFKHLFIGHFLIQLLFTNLYLTVGDICAPDNCLSVHHRPFQCIPAIFFSAVSPAMFSFGYDTPVFFGSATFSTLDTFPLLGVGSGFFGNELLWSVFL